MKVDVVELSVKLQCVAWEHDNRWIARCPSLDVVSQGQSREEAKQCIEEAVRLWVESCLERGKLGEALEEVGWRKTRPGEPVSESDNSIWVREYSVDDPAHLREAGADREQADFFPVTITIPAFQAMALLNEHRAG